MVIVSWFILCAPTKKEKKKTCYSIASGTVGKGAGRLMPP